MVFLAAVFVRRMGNAGRIKIPSVLCNEMEITNETILEIFVTDEGYILLKKCVAACAICGEKRYLVPFKNKHVCTLCQEKLK